MKELNVRYLFSRMQLIFAYSGFSGTSYHLAWQGGPTDFDLGGQPGSESHGGGSPAHLRAGARSRGVCLAANGQDAGRATTQTGRHSLYAFGHEADLREGDHSSASQKTGRQEGTQGQSPTAAANHSSARGPAPGTLPRLPEPGETVSADADAHRRR